jgi:O-acetyl-ADP-ribose deacetylase (regulator of RNase III)
VLGGARDEAALLASAYRNSLTLAAEHDARTIAFPSISTGVYHYPIEKAAPLALSIARDYALAHGNFREIRFVLFSAEAFRAFSAALETLSMVMVH